MSLDYLRVTTDDLARENYRANFLTGAICNKEIFEGLDRDTQDKVKPYRQKYLDGKSLDEKDYISLKEILSQGDEPR